MSIGRAIIAVSACLLSFAGAHALARVGGGQSYRGGGGSSYRPSTTHRSSTPSRSSSSRSSSSSRTYSAPPPPTVTYKANRSGPVPPLDPSVLTCPGPDCVDPVNVVAQVGLDRHRYRKRALAAGGVALLVGIVFLVRRVRKRPRIARPGADPIALVLTHDPAFSRHVFADFVTLLYTRVMEARGTPGVSVARAWLTPTMLDSFAMSPDGPATAVVIGVQRPIASRVRDGRVELDVSIEATFAEAPGGTTRGRYRSDRWVFARKVGATSPEPARTRSLGCPSCGAAGELTVEGRCTHCDQVVNAGDFGWVLISASSLAATAIPPLEVTPDQGGAEPGTRRRTIVQRDLETNKAALQARSPSFSWELFLALVHHTFLELQTAWSSLEWERARAFETDALYQTHRYWIERYQRTGLRNELKDPKITKLEVVKVDHDAWYEAITLRVHASMIDCVRDGTGKLVGGNDRIPRVFTEYWTFIRSAGHEERPRDLSACPSCGAALKVSAAGICSHCDTKVTTGEHGWVLTSIEQDDSYAG